MTIDSNHSPVKPDMRTGEGRFVCEWQAKLFKLVAQRGRPGVIDRHLIDRWCWLQVHIMRIEKKLVAQEPLTAAEIAAHSDLNNCALVILSQLGIAADAPGLTGNPGLSRPHPAPISEVA